MIISIILFTVCWIITYHFAKTHFNNHYQQYARRERFVDKNKMPILIVIVISLFCTFYNYYITAYGSGFGSDRQNYLEAFETGRPESPGLDVFIIIIKLMGGEYTDLLYISTFVTIFIVLLAYRYSKNATPYTILLLFLTSLVFQSFTAIKQTYTTAFATLFFVLMFEKNGILKDAICILLIVLSCLFHATGYILIPIYILIKSKIQFKSPLKLMLVALLFVFLFKPIMLFIAQYTNSVFPYLSLKILDYFGEDSDASEGSIIQIFKGIPFYYITYLFFKYSTRLRSEIKQFDTYLILTLFASLCYVSSFYNVWMMRMVDLFSFIVFVFWTISVQYLPNPKAKKRNAALILALFTYRWLIMIYINFGTF